MRQLWSFLHALVDTQLKLNVFTFRNTFNNAVPLKEDSRYYQVQIHGFYYKVRKKKPKKLLNAHWSTLCHLFYFNAEETLNVRKHNFVLLTSISIASQSPAISRIITAALHSQKSCHKDRKWINEYLCCCVLLLLLPHSIREEIKAHKRKLINSYS